MTSHKIELTREIFSTLKVSKSFEDFNAPISSISFNETGESFLTTAQDDSLKTFNCVEGT